ncbi:MAG TPA: Ig-like domain-containing protein [Longimicrobium sp.]|nr:Ig-like domain-containing protein [Longimicrobium sp.]
MRTSWIGSLVALLLMLPACRDAAGPGAAVSELRFSPAAPHVEAGKGLQLSLEALDPFGRPVAVKAGGFRSDEPAIATVSATGVVTGVARGSTRIRAVAPGSAEAVVTLVVDPRGGLEPDSLRVVLPDPADRRISVDAWPLTPQVLRFTLRNVAGESLCGLVPVRIRIRDPEMLVASYQPDRDGCTIPLAVGPAGPVYGGITQMWLTAGNLTDSMYVTAYGNEYRVTFGSVPMAVRTLPAGGLLRYEVSAVARDGTPAAGVPVNFEIDTARVHGVPGAWWSGIPASKVTVPTDSTGMAAVVARAPTSALINIGDVNNRDYLDRGLSVSAWSNQLHLYHQGVYDEPVRVVAAEPDRIAIYVEHARWRYRETIEVRGDTAVVGELVPCSPLWPQTSEWVSAALVDRHGNVSSKLPGVSAASVAYTASWSGFYLWYSWMGSHQGMSYYDGVMLSVRGERPLDPATYTFSYPGLPSRTVRVLPTAKCGE